MKRSHVLILTALLLTPLASLRAADTPQPATALAVVNGDFSDLSGLSQGQDGWHGGLPSGWQGSDSTYAVHATRGATAPTCNPSTLGFFRQRVGTLARDSDLVLRFDVSEPWRPDVVLTATVFDGHFVPLASGDFQPAAGQRLVARGVPAGTSVVIAFQAARGVPGLDNVSLEVVSLDVPAAASAALPPASPPAPAITVACYYFGNPNVTMGWDSSPRAHQDDEFGNFGYPFMNTISGNTPERFQEALIMAKRRLLAKPGGPRILNINCWNEWTEGSYLEPDIVHGMKYLEAILSL
jgi:hypothetical protein